MYVGSIVRGRVGETFRHRDMDPYDLQMTTEKGWSPDQGNKPSPMQYRHSVVGGIRQQFNSMYLNQLACGPF